MWRSGLSIWKSTGGALFLERVAQNDDACGVQSRIVADVSQWDASARYFLLLAGYLLITFLRVRKIERRLDRLESGDDA